MMSIEENTLPVLNFVWIGPPYLPGLCGSKTYLDVYGVQTFVENFKKFSSTPNKIVFWCQCEYHEHYTEYFQQKNLPIIVKKIRPYLLTNPIATDLVLQIYDTLLSETRNTIRDRVTVKNMMFNVILANEGDYVLDTSMIANPNEKLNLPQYDKFMFPTFSDFTLPTMTNAGCEVWMQYAPRENLVRAKECLNCFLELYQAVENLVQNKAFTYSSELYHDYMGHIAVAAVRQQNSFFGLLAYGDYDTWSCQKITNEVTVPGLNVIKIYSNTHKFKHIKNIFADGSLELIKKHLSLGFDPNTVSTYVIENQYFTNLPLSTLMKRLLLCGESMIEEYSDRIVLLLESGASPNQVFKHQKCNSEKEWKLESPLTLAIKLMSKRPDRMLKYLRLLFSHSTVPILIDQIINDQSLLMLAVDKGCTEAVHFLLDNNANPNIHNTPLRGWRLFQCVTSPSILEVAISTRNIENIELLLKSGAQIDILPNDINITSECQELISKYKTTNIYQEF